MNYPFRNAVIDYIMNGDASLMQDRIETILENYPPEVVHCLMNILGTHDTVRILTALGENDLPEHAGRAEGRMAHGREADVPRPAEAENGGRHQYDAAGRSVRILWR